MKKLLIAAIAGLLTLGLAACEQRIEPAASTSETPSATAPSTESTAPAATTEAPDAAKVVVEPAKPAEPAKSE